MQLFASSETLRKIEEDAKKEAEERAKLEKAAREFAKAIKA